MLGYNTKPHNLLWNELRGYLVFSLENMVILEQLDSGKKQKIVHFPQTVTCLEFNNNKT
jgi:hypothetical protein